jgi:hypothetical protein
MPSGPVFASTGRQMEELKRLARDLGTTVGEAVAIAARRLRQQRMGRDLNTPLTADEKSWLDADLG